MPTACGLRAAPTKQPPKLDDHEPAVAQLFQECTDEVTSAVSSIGNPVQQVSRSQMPRLKLPNRDIATPRGPTSRFHGTVSKLVQAFEVKPTRGEQSRSCSPLKTSRQHPDASVSHITPRNPPLKTSRQHAVASMSHLTPRKSPLMTSRQHLTTPRKPSHRHSLPVKKLDDGRFLKQRNIVDSGTLYKPMGIVDIDIGVPTSCEVDLDELCYEMTASTIGSIGDPESTTSSFTSMAYGPSSITLVTPRSATDSFENCAYDEDLQNTNDALPLPTMRPQNELPEVSIESENQGMISTKFTIAGVVEKSLVAYPISSCSRSVSPCSVSQRLTRRDRCGYPDQYFLPVYPTKFITHIQDGHVGVAIMFPDPGGIFRKAADACKAVRSSTKAAFDEASKLAQTSIGKSALTGAALLGVAGGGSGAISGSGVGALVGIFMAPLTLGLSIPVGACIGCGAGTCIGVTAGGAVGAASGGALAYAFQEKCEDKTFAGPSDQYAHVIQNA